MANIYKRGKTWWGRVRKNGVQHRRSLETTDRALAETRLRKWLDDLEAVAYGAAPRRTFEDAAEYFILNHLPTLKPQSQRRYRTSLRKLVGSEIFDGLYLDQIVRAKLADFENYRRAEGASAPTIRRDFACLSSLIENAIVDWDLPVLNAVKPYLKFRSKRGLKEAPPRTRYLTHDEEAALIGQAKAYMAHLIAFAIESGLRFEEQFSLTWGQVDLSRRRLTISRAQSKNSRARVVPLSERAVTILDTLPRHLRRNNETDWVFCKSDGSRYKRLTRGLAGTADRAGVQDLQWHDLRRTCGCRLLQDIGYRLEDVRDFLGHSSVKTTERAYIARHAKLDS